VVITTKDGLQWNLFFGSVALGDEQDTDENSAKKAKEAAKDQKEDGRNRYLAIFVRYDEKSDEDAKKAAEEAAKQAADKKDGDKKDEAKKDDKKDPKQIGMDKAKKAQAKFGQYFYVISDENFKNMKPAIDKLFEAKPEEKKDDKKDGAAAPAGTPAPAAPAPAK
jgi:hypothetical protein